MEIGGKEPLHPNLITWPKIWGFYVTHIKKKCRNTSNRLSKSVLFNLSGRPSQWVGRLIISKYQGDADYNPYKK